MNLTKRLEKLLGDEENKNLVVQLIHQQVHPSNVLAILSILEAKNCYNWITGTEAETTITAMLELNLPTNAILKGNRYSAGNLFKIAITVSTFLSEENLMVVQENYQNYCNFLIESSMNELKQNDTRLNSNI